MDKPRPQFDIDLRFGQSRELSFAEVLMIRGGHLLELKSDQKCASTGNVFVEYEQQGKPSGVRTTESHWWTTEVANNVFVTMPTETLLNLARLYWHTRRPGGDNNNWGVLVPVTDLVKPNKSDEAKKAA